MMLRLLIMVLWFIAIVLYGIICATARDNGQWQYSSPDIAEYFGMLRQPDNPGISCCGAADAYWADLTDTDAAGNLYAIITDERDDAPLARQHVDPGTRIFVPPHKIRRPAIANPTGHTIIFLSAATKAVWCYEPQPLM